MRLHDPLLPLLLTAALAGCADRLTSPKVPASIGPSASVVVLPPGSFYLGDITLTGGYTAGHAPQTWSLVNCSLTIIARADLSGLSDAAGAHAWSELGVRQVGAADFNPAPGTGVWLATDYDWTPGTFAPDPAGSPTFDMDDKFLVQKVGGQDESAYDLFGIPGVSGTPPDPSKNHRFWFDRDGVDPWQAASPLAENGVTYNTGGYYNVALDLHALGPTSGTAYMDFDLRLKQGFETDGDWNTIEMTPAGMTFSGDMNGMQVFWGLYGYGAAHTVTFRDVSVHGCLVLSAGMATGGGWFVPEANAVGLTLNGSRATFGFNAKQKEGVSSGELKFEYRADGIDLVSTGYDWVTIASGQAMFEGSGTINGTGSYKFRVRAIDGDQTGAADRFEIRIWTPDHNVYDVLYRAEGNLSGGQIVVHK